MGADIGPGGVGLDAGQALEGAYFGWGAGGEVSLAELTHGNTPLRKNGMARPGHQEGIVY
jgi:hypothetical protein